MRHAPCVLGILLAACVVPVGAEAPSTTLVVCAPGYPSNTEEAQPTMDELAQTLLQQTGPDAGRLAAVYHPTIEGGLSALSDERSGLALVPLPFYLEYRTQLDLRPLLRVVSASGSAVWSVVARRGALAGPDGLAGWELAGMPGYAPRFVRGVALAEWGELPANLEIRFTSRMLSVLRKAVAGEKVAAILDRDQTESLGGLPFADELEVAASSRPMVESLLCRVGDRVADDAARRWADAFAGLNATDHVGLLETLRIKSFEPVAANELAVIEQAFDRLGQLSR